MNGRSKGGFALCAVIGALALLAACSSDGLGGAQCNCPSGVGEATIELCSSIGSATADPDGICSLQQSSGRLIVMTDVPGTCHVEATLATGATASTDITFTSGEWLSCGTDPHGCGQMIVATPTTATLGPCGEAGTAEDAGGE